MTTETAQATEQTAVQKLESQIAELDSELAKIQPDIDAKVAQIVSVQPIDTLALAAATAPAATLDAKRKSLTEKLVEARKSDEWESSIEMRQPMLDALRDLIVEAKPTVNIAAVTGTMAIGDDSAVTVSLKPSVKLPEMTEIEALIAETVDVAAFVKAGFKSLDISVSKIGEPDALISIAPSGARKATTPKPASNGTTSGTRSGALEYNVDGTWMSARSMLQHASADLAENEHVKSHAKALANVLAGGNGMSNLAKTLGAKLGYESRPKDPDA